jgi:hypothetical protein
MKRILVLGLLTLGFTMSAMEPSRDFIAEYETIVVSPHKSIFVDQVTLTDVTSFENYSESFVLKNFDFVAPLFSVDVSHGCDGFNYQKHFESELYKQREAVVNSIFIDNPKIKILDKLLLYHPVHYKQDIERQHPKNIFHNTCFL